jgi:dolichol kinase
MSGAAFFFLAAGLAVGVWLLSLVGRHWLRLSPLVTRNSLHIAAGIWGWLWLQAPSYGWAVALPITATVGLFIADWARQRWASIRWLAAAFAWKEGGSHGAVLFPASITLLCALFWQEKAIGTAAIFALALGDGMAEAVGRFWGLVPFKFPWTGTRTLTGSLACWVFCALGVFLGYLATNTPLPIWIPFAAGALGALAEAVSPRMLDNLLVPGVVALFLWVMR